MKRFLVSIVCFIVLICIVDLLYGVCCNYMNSHPKRGETYYRNYLVNESVDDVVMFGSSRMVHHYVSNIIADSLGMTVWNAGVDGMGIIMNYGYLELLLRHHTPKFILYDLSPYDICREDNVKQLRNLKPYVGVDEIKEIIKSVEPIELIKLHSHLFMYNSSLLPLLRDFIKPGGKGDNNGYSPLFMVMDDTMAKDSEGSPIIDLKIDNLKIGLLEKFVSLCEERGIQLFMFISPEFCRNSTALSTTIVKMIKDRATIYNYSFVDGISNNYHLFQDREHLNIEGSVKYTKFLTAQLKSF